MAGRGHHLPVAKLLQLPCLLLFLGSFGTAMAAYCDSCSGPCYLDSYGYWHCSKGDPQTPVGAILGGVIGFIAFVIFAVLLVFLYMRQQKRRPHIIASGQRPTGPPGYPPSQAYPGGTYPPPGSFPAPVYAQPYPQQPYPQQPYPQQPSPAPPVAQV